MKLTYIYLIVLCVGCRSVRQKQEVQQKAASANIQWQLMEQHQRIGYVDSQDRHWSFWTDSLFYFHPDSGLSAYGGTMKYRDVHRRNGSEEVQYLTKDSVAASNDRSSVYSWIKKDAKTTFGFGITLLILVAGLVYWFYRKVK
ncbi:hypothetical protein [Sphingobacterium pedocola]|uniref:DUF4178 domain-containing protein n=1 Tax=Sphingobacterium pedocola TaxID=2082722 RepID=A0ABR9T899_9SPHI|nr:hypothetical protein [Sphingobacterium pedocola]MBE8721575.1 hypothetical protein [Sphingobacterium pedocola]